MRKRGFFRPKINRFLTTAYSFNFFLWILLMVSGIIFFTDSDRGSYAGEVTYDSHGKRDPFIPLVSTRSVTVPGEILGVQTVDDARIEGVVYDPKHGSVVIINGAVLKEGQEMGNVKVLQVKGNGARIEVNGEEAFKALFTETARETESVENA